MAFVHALLKWTTGSQGLFAFTLVTLNHCHMLLNLIGLNFKTITWTELFMLRFGKQPNIGITMVSFVMCLYNQRYPFQRYTPQARHRLTIIAVIFK